MTFQAPFTRISRPPFGPGLSTGVSYVVYDDFTGDDNTNINGRTPTITPGGNWIGTQGTPKIFNNHFEAQTTGLKSARIDSGLSDCIITYDLKLLTSTGYTYYTDNSVLFRFLDNWNYLSVRYGRYGGPANLLRFSINERVANVETIKDSVILSFVDASEHTISVTLNDETITATVDGGNLLTYNSAAFQKTLTHHCPILNYSSGTVTTFPWIDNFAIQAL